MKGMFTVEARDLQMFNSGDIMVRKGLHVEAYNELKVEAAIKRMEAGETILLTRNGVVTSKMKLVNGMYTEMEM